MTMNLGADSKLFQGVDGFIKEVEDDFSAPHQSNFQHYMQKVKRDLQEMEEVSGKGMASQARVHVCYTSLYICIYI